MGYTCQLRVKFVTAEWIDDHEHLGPGHLVFTAEAASGAETLLLNVTRQACDVLQKIVGCPAIHTLLVVVGERHCRGACVLGAVLVALRAVETWDQALGLMKQQSPPGGEIHVSSSGNALMALLVTALRQDPAAPPPCTTRTAGTNNVVVAVALMIFDPVGALAINKNPDQQI